MCYCVVYNGAWGYELQIESAVPDSSPCFCLAGARVARRMLCKNCGAHQTPQWRCGPLGPRTLCNACGVRYKKGLPLTGMPRSTELV